MSAPDPKRKFPASSECSIVKLKQAGEEAEIARRLGSILYVPLDGAFRGRFALGEHQVSKSEDRKMGFQFKRFDL